MNAENIDLLNIFLGSGAILLQILSLVTLVILFFILPAQKKRGEINKFLNYLDKNFLAIGFLLSLAAALFSLIYSEVVGFAPCLLCWWQRVFLFPQVFLFGIALWNRDRKVLKYSLPLLSVGFIFAAYQTFEYYFTESSASTPCDASGVSCYQRLVSEFGGYISIPVLSLTIFAALLVLILVVHFHKK